MPPPANQENLTEFYNEVFLPAVQALGIMHDGQGPFLSEENPYTVVSTWSEVLQIEDIDKLIKFSMDKTAYKSVAEWMQDKDNLYSVYPVGGVPKKIIDSYGLLKRNLHEDDAVKLNNLFTKTSPTANNDEDNDDTDDENEETTGTTTEETPTKVKTPSNRPLVTPSTTKEKENKRKSSSSRGPGRPKSGS